MIILGGLIRDKETTAVSKVPFLGSIPVLGMLFRSKTYSTEKQNLLVFLRPTVLTTKADISKVSERKYNRVFQVEIEGTSTVPERISELFDGNL